MQDTEPSPRHIVVMGVSSCGKSAIGKLLAEKLGLPYIEGDDDHTEENIAKMHAGVPLTDADRHAWLLILQERLRAAVEQGNGVVLTCSSLKRRYRDILRQGVPDLYFLHLHGERDLIAQRMRARKGHFMPATMLDSQFADLEMLQADEAGCVVDIVPMPFEIVENALQCPGFL